MVQKTYGVFGLMELVVDVRLGRRTLSIPFTGGLSSNRGVTPATYTTHNAVVQFAIEHSVPFRTGRVRLVKATDTAATAGGEARQEEKQKEQKEPAHVPVACVDDARDYLAAHFGIEPSKLRTRQMLDTQAKAHGIVFEGI